MAGKEKSVLTDVGSSLLKGPVGDRLKQEARDFAKARGSDIVQSLGGRLEGVTQRLEEHAENPNGRKDKNNDDGQEDGEDSQPGRLASLGSGLKDKAKSLVGKGDDEDDGDGEDGDGDGEGGEKKGRGKGRSGPKMTNIIEDINVGVPVSVAYDQWTQFQEFGSFMKGVRGVDAKDEVESNWRGKVWWSTRSWSARVTEQVPDRKIAWTTDGAKGTTKGTVTFHPLADDLTKILVVVEYYPKGFMEKTANIWRAFGRRVRLDLKHFRRFVTTQGEASGSWRGEIRDGEVVREPDENDDYRREDDYRPPNRLNSDDEAPEDDDDFDDEFDDEDDEFDDEDDQFDDEDDEPADESDEDGEPSDESDEDEPGDESDQDEPGDESQRDEPAAESDQGDEPSDGSEDGSDEPAERPARRRRPSSREGSRKRPRRRSDGESGDGSDEPSAESDQGDEPSDGSEDGSDEPVERPARRRRPSSREGQRSERSSDGERNGHSTEGRRSPRRTRKSAASA